MENEGNQGASNKGKNQGNALFPVKPKSDSLERGYYARGSAEAMQRKSLMWQLFDILRGIKSGKKPPLQ